MYERPTLERYGGFRQLTQLGSVGASDGCSISGIGGTVAGNNIPIPPGGLPAGFCHS